MLNKLTSGLLPEAYKETITPNLEGNHVLGQITCMFHGKSEDWHEPANSLDDIPSHLLESDLNKDTAGSSTRYQSSTELDHSAKTVQGLTSHLLEMDLNKDAADTTIRLESVKANEVTYSCKEKSSAYPSSLGVASGRENSEVYQ